jgi:hypothetical protein
VITSTFQRQQHGSCPPDDSGTNTASTPLQRRACQTEVTPSILPEDKDLCRASLAMR